MANEYDIGDLVVLKSGSMRMCVEAVEDAAVAVVWCHEGQVGRDRFDTRLLNKWEHREDSRPHHDRGERGERHGGGGGFRGHRGGEREERGHDRGPDRRGGWQDRGGDRDRDRGGDRDRDDRPPRKTGWDGKPRDKKYFRKDD
jgi:uncharacterized protein YodC (DUF2158 family)